jgi:hypothetical protein
MSAGELMSRCPGDDNGHDHLLLARGMISMRTHSDSTQVGYADFRLAKAGAYVILHNSLDMRRFLS